MKTLEELNLVDDFLVNSLTSHKIYGEQSARYILECILHRQIGKLTVVPQRFFCGENTETHGIRLDVYLDEENGEIFDIEPDQNDGKEEIESLQERITGRFSCETIKNKDGEVIVKANHMITPKRAARIMKEGVDNQTGGSIEKVKIRTILTCKCKVGICAKCYGANLATGEAVHVGESVGIIAAQSIGKQVNPRLTLFHTDPVSRSQTDRSLKQVMNLQKVA